MRFAFPLVMLLVFTVHAGAGEEGFAGPVKAHVLRVLDGDTFAAEALIWPGQSLRVNIRIRGIDAPEVHARCPAEAAAARTAQASLAGFLASGRVVIRNIGGAKYYGRVLADVELEDGSDLAAMLLASAAVRAYGGGKRQPFCP